MEAVTMWVAGLCVCAAAVGLAEKLLPEGSVKGAVHFVMGLVVMSCFLSPVGDITAEEPVIPEQEIKTDWLNRTTRDMFASNVRKLVEKCLDDMGVRAKNIDVYTDIDSDGSIYIDKVRITVAKEYTDSIDDICSAVYSGLGLDADVIVR